MVAYAISLYSHCNFTYTGLKTYPKSFTTSFLCTHLDRRNLKTPHTPQVYQEGSIDSVNQCVDFSGGNMNLHPLTVCSMAIYVEKLFSFCCSFACFNKGTEFPHLISPQKERALFLRTAHRLTLERSLLNNRKMHSFLI